MTSCAHGMPTPASCIDCMDEGNIAPVIRHGWQRFGPEFVARFGGTCWTCDRPLEIGAVIQGWEDDERLVYAHAHCGRPG